MKKRWKELILGNKKEKPTNERKLRKKRKDKNRKRKTNYYENLK